MGLGSILGVIASLITIFFGIRELPKFWRWFDKKCEAWARNGIMVIYVWVSHGNQGSVTVYLYLCGEESYGLFPSHRDDNRESYILAMRQIHYHTSYPSNSDRDDPRAEWTAMEVHSLSEDESPCLVKLIDDCRFRFSLHNENGETKTVFDSFRFKTELKECLKKCEIKYVRKASSPQDRWKARDK